MNWGAKQRKKGLSAEGKKEHPATPSSQPRPALFDCTASCDLQHIVFRVTSTAFFLHRALVVPTLNSWIHGLCWDHFKGSTLHNEWGGRNISGNRDLVGICMRPLILIWWSSKEKQIKKLTLSFLSKGTISCSTEWRHLQSDDLTGKRDTGCQLAKQERSKGWFWHPIKTPFF